MPDKKTENQPIIITFTIDPTMKLNTRGERTMAVSVVARQGDVGQVSRFDMSNWKTDLPAEVDRLMRLLLGGTLTLPDFPDMGQTVPIVEKSAEPEEALDGDKEPAQVEDEVAVEPESEASMDEGEDYDISLYPATDDAGEVSPSQPGLF
jgi:hypothetical protein